MSKILDINGLFILGYAGHGKDSVRTIIENNYENTFYPISFAETLKRQISLMLTEEQLEKTGTTNRLDAANKLKDEFPGYSVYNNFDMRKFMQLVGTEFFRDNIHSDIHIKFCAKKMLKILEDNTISNPLFVSCDTRFPNEYSFGVNFGEIKDLDMKKDFLKFYISRDNPEISMDKLREIFFKTFNVSSDDSFSKKYLEIVSNDLKELAKMDFTKDWSKELDYPASVKGLSVENALKHGIFHIFRPIINPETNYPQDTRTSKIIELIKEYTGLSVDRILKIQDYYEVSGLDFTLENIQKVGFARANVSHYSETALNDIKPLPFLSTPMYNQQLAKEFEEKIIKVFDNFVLSKENDLSKKNKNETHRIKLK